MNGLTVKLEIQDYGAFMEKPLLTLPTQTGTFIPTSTAAECMRPP